MSFAWKDLKRWCVSTATKILNVCFCLINILKCLLQWSNWREGRGAIWLPWPAKCNLPTNRFFVRCRHFACFGVFSDYKTFPTTKAFGKTFPTTKALRKTFPTTKENLPDFVLQRKTFPTLLYEFYRFQRPDSSLAAYIKCLCKSEVYATARNQLRSKQKKHRFYFST